MITEVCPCNEDSLSRAAELIKAGEVVGFPTETVYGLGANALDIQAVNKIFAAKGRPGDNPLIVHISKLSDIDALISGDMPSPAKTLAERFWPGPMTIILKRSKIVPDCVTAGLNTVGIRMPSNPYARRLIELSGCPIAAPSANLSGRPSPTTAQRVFADMNSRIPMILDGGECEVGVESTVIDMTGEIPRILRPGGVTPEDIAKAIGLSEVDEHVMSPLDSNDKPRSPGMKYKHYAPKGDMTIFMGDAREKIISAYDSSKGKPVILALDNNMSAYYPRRVISLGKDAREMAARLFEALRESDDMGCDVLLSEGVEPVGIGLAVMNRMARAAAFRIIV